MQLKSAAFFLVLLSHLHKGLASPGDVPITSEQANDFRGELTRSRRGLYHECYYERCSWEEVREVKGNTEAGREYYYDYRCYIYGKDCKVTCYYRQDCSFGEWGSWYSHANVHGCYQQTRVRPLRHLLSKTMRRWNCNGLKTSCPNHPTEKRTYCVCRKVNCQLGSWSSWKGASVTGKCSDHRRTRSYTATFVSQHQINSCDGIPTKCNDPQAQIKKVCNCKVVECGVKAWSGWSGEVNAIGSCAQQTRTKESYIIKEKYVNADNNCEGVSNACGPTQTQQRRMCNCAKVTCVAGEFGRWKGEIGADECGEQTRSRSLTVTKSAQLQQNNCVGIQSSCSPLIPERRNICNCPYREDCSVKEWGPWKGDIPREGCADQIRSREYNSSIIHVMRENCNELEKCRTIVDNVRVMCSCKHAICRWGQWFQQGFDSNKGCHIEVRIQNITSEYNTKQRENDCTGIIRDCGNGNAKREKRENCISGGGGIITSPPPTEAPITVTVKPTTADFHTKYLGCFRDRKERAMGQLIANRRSLIDWYHMNSTVKQCAFEAFKRRYRYFAVQFYGECWSGNDNQTRNYSEYGESKECWKGVGQSWTNAVYLQHLPPCSDPLTFKISHSSGSVNDVGIWCSGQTDANQWLSANFDRPTRITAVATLGDQKDSWVIVYSLEFSEDGNVWIPYKEYGATKLYAGNSERFTFELRWLKNPIEAMHVRFKPVSWQSAGICMEVKIYGCAT